MTYIIHYSKFLRYQERKIRNFHSRVRGVVLSNNGTSIDKPFMMPILQKMEVGGQADGRMTKNGHEQDIGI